MRIKLKRGDLLPNPAKNRRGKSIWCDRRRNLGHYRQAMINPNPESRLTGATTSVFLYARARFYT
jgi:hypothetical protein